ncbi:putative membrane protein YdjX (TVP38/TMEM64 family) [Litoreibacter halocynthiae]|uniref:TVP38/TMEM64 family membrane protein n=1 Tax=Litoreibacter halocynthiae TaxID=1242689 RepID=A0A4R7LEA9_9RHOB|nr:TVP38/TMEM64 family protein [Litoreibacter halocynthiae]TDT72686.1 putative membrane protein YdjX (TVP38/TMEM64 family) [Litoreibacter halocynthiae]
MDLKRVGALILFAFALVSVALWATGLLPQVDQQMIAALVEKAGPWGPILIIVLMLASIVASPIPSAPVALISGAAYGHFSGAIYVAIGSVLGAITAFSIARHLGRDYVERWLGDKANFGLLGSQNLLMLTVFGSRLLPFVSFDAMSYAAGLSRLHLWRFLIATLAGILPASFVLAHFGAEAMTGEFGQAEWIIVGLGLTTALPLIITAIWRGSKRARP